MDNETRSDIPESASSPIMSDVRGIPRLGFHAGSSTRRTDFKSGCDHRLEEESVSSSGYEMARRPCAARQHGVELTSGGNPPGENWISPSPRGAVTPSAH